MPAFLPPTALPFSSTTLLGHPHRASHRRKHPISSRSHWPQSPRCAHSDVAIIGAGLAGLSIAQELSHRGASVTLLSATKYRKPAGLAAAGMLAPSLEQLEAPLRDLCHHSHALYPSFTNRLRQLSDIDPQYISRGDFLTPLLRGQPVDPEKEWLSEQQTRLIEPTFGPSVVAASRNPREAHVDNRLLMAALQVSCERLGVSIVEDAFVQRIIINPDGLTVDALQTHSGDRIHAGHFILAAGAWSRELLPSLPVRPIKGQMLSLRAPPHILQVPNHVMYGSDVYIVPKKDGREFFVGATEEEGTFSESNTPSGIMKLLNAAVELVPTFAEYEILQTWSGFRPATPDLLPVLGMSEYDNMSIATGYFRNGILLAPATAKIAAATALGETGELPNELLELIPNFSLQRFFKASPAASEVRQRKSGPSASVGEIKAVTQDSQPVPSSLKSSLPAGVDVSEIKVWRTLPDGTKEPVLPAYHDGSAKDKPEPKQTQFSPSAPSQAALIQEQLHKVTRDKEGEQSDTRDLENVSAPKDAYEDIMQHRNNADHVMDEALAANRAFGRTKSSLEKEGVPPLSLSEEELNAFDEAFAQGMEDFREADNTFNDNHPSVLATKAEMATAQRTRTSDTQGVNGVSLTVPDGEASSKDEPGHFGGYY